MEKDITCKYWSKREKKVKKKALLTEDAVNLKARKGQV